MEYELLAPEIIEIPVDVLGLAKPGSLQSAYKLS
jgi:hypothetical protein